MNHLDIISLWIEALNIPVDNYYVSIDENEKEVHFQINIDKNYIGKILGVSGSILTSLKRLLNCTYQKTRKKVVIKVSER